MTELVLLPLKVFPGWPQPEPVSGLFLLMLTVVVPLGVGAIVVAIFKAPEWRARGREDARAVGMVELDGDGVADDLALPAEGQARRSA
ncbi:hypothetical protein [Aestuariimicrobium ganziense]|uniref:hypothetical protein n=1 Tax=Aestuariimicrobium ganziense TaxID=2773677 RepID=UPI00194340B3|nr:hypothetical protein [Aestuariimicrobium ganziense]